MPGVTRDPKIDQYIASKLVSGEISQRTSVEYRRDLERMGQFLEERQAGPYQKLYDVTKDDINRFLAVVRQNNNVNSTNRKLAAIRGFYQFLVREKYRPDNPAEEVNLPKAQRGYDREFILTRGEIQKLLNAPSSDNFKWRDFGARDRALLHFCYSGPKRGELPDVRIDDVDLENQQINVNGRIVPLKKEAAEAIATYLRVRPNAKERALFLTNNHASLTVRQAWVILKKYVRQCKLNPKTDFETLRASYAVHALEDGVWFMDVLSALGNVTSTILQNYARLAKIGPKEPSSVGEVLTTVQPFKKFYDGLRHIRETVVTTILKYAQGDTGALEDAKTAVELQIKTLESNWPGITSQPPFEALKLHARAADIDDFHDILDRDLPVLESVALNMLSDSQQKKEHVAFIALLHPEIIHASLRHYEDGDYHESLASATRALADILREKSGIDDDGVSLATKALKPGEGVLLLPNTTKQEGIYNVVAGALQSLNDPEGHDFSNEVTQRIASQYLIFISLLMSEVEQAKLRLRSV